jgi:four helix bundle protein
MTDLKERTKAFALRIVRMFTALPKTTEAQVIGKQVLRSGTAVGAHYREAYRSRSDAEYIAKIELALQELEETGYWLELLVGAEIVSQSRLTELQAELNEITAMLVTCVKTAKAKKDGGKRTEGGNKDQQPN